MDIMPSSSFQSPATRLLWPASTILICAHFSLVYTTRSSQFLNLALYARGAERNPFQSRVLMAWIFRVTAAKLVRSGLFSRLASTFPHPLQDAYVFVLALVVFSCLLIAVFATRATLLHLTQDIPFSSWASLLVVYMCYFNLSSIYGLTYALPYDVPSLALFSLAVLLVIKSRYWLLLPVYILGTLNRETFCFVTLFLAAYSYFQQQSLGTVFTKRKRRLSTAFHIGLQTCIWLFVRLWTHHHFLHNPSEGELSNSQFQIHFIHNLKSLINPYQWPLYFSIFGFSVPFVVLNRRWISNEALAYSVWITATCWVIGMLIVGVLVEIRIFNELSSFMTLVVGLIIWNRWIAPDRHDVTT